MTARLGFVGMLVASLCFGGGCDGDSQLVPRPCPTVDPFCQKDQGRSWSSAKDDLTFDAAKDYCSSIGGRLPTISELRSLIFQCDTTGSLGSCRITDTCTSFATCLDHMPCVGCGDGGLSVFGNGDHFWSSTPVADQPGDIWTVTFRYSAINPNRSDYPISAYCLGR